jgi:hypothetical protein
MKANVKKPSPTMVPVLPVSTLAPITINQLVISHPSHTPPLSWHPPPRQHRYGMSSRENVVNTRRSDGSPWSVHLRDYPSTWDAFRQHSHTSQPLLPMFSIKLTFCLLVLIAEKVAFPQKYAMLLLAISYSLLYCGFYQKLPDVVGLTLRTIPQRISRTTQTVSIGWK